MSAYLRICVCVLLVPVLATSVLAPRNCAAQTKKTKKVVAKPPESAVFNDALARAKAGGQPLIVFGMADGCSRCAAFKQGLAKQEDLQQLLSQYVSVEVPFGGPDFVAMYRNMVRQRPEFNQAIGGPSVFLFTAKGDAVYAGPNDANGMPANETFKQLLIEGLAKNGPAKKPAAPASELTGAKTNKPPSEKARQWKSTSGHSVSAHLVNFDGKAVELRTEDGRNVRLAIDLLSAADQEYVRTSKP
jgi:hypothetical protein